MERILRSTAAECIDYAFTHARILSDPVFADDIAIIRLELMKMLERWGVIAPAWRPVQEVLSTMLLMEAGQNKTPLTVRYEAENGSTTLVAFTIRYQLDDGGPWVGETSEGKWVLFHHGQQVGGQFWALVIRDEQPRQWFER